jgi:hypothetical protein
MGWRFLKDFLRHLAVQAVGADDDLGEQFGLGAGEMLGCAVGLGTAERVAAWCSPVAKGDEYFQGLGLTLRTELDLRITGWGAANTRSPPAFLGTSAETGTEFLIWTSVVGSVLPVGCGPVDRGLRINAVRRAGHGGRCRGSPFSTVNARVCVRARAGLMLP